MTRSIAASDWFGPEFLEPLGTVPVFTAFGFFFVFGIGVLGQPHMLHKFYMLDDARKLRWMPLILGGSQAACVLIWVGIGLAVPALVAQGRLEPLVRPDDAAPLFLLRFAPGLLAGTAVAGILAAIMSTADSFLNIGAAALVRDLGDELRDAASAADALRVGTRTLEAADHLFANLACRSARRKGEVLDPREQQALLDALDAIPWAPTCPHGRPVFIPFELAEIERRFGRR